MRGDSTALRSKKTQSGRFSHRTQRLISPLHTAFVSKGSFPPAVRKSSAVDLDCTGAAQCGSPSSRAPPSCLETPSYTM